MQNAPSLPTTADADSNAPKQDEGKRKKKRLAGWIAGVRDRPDVKALSTAAKLGDQEPLYAMAALIAAIGLSSGRRGLVRAGVRMAAAVVLADLLKSLVKSRVARSRPNIVIDEDRYVEEADPKGEHGKPDQSFPSGHVACALAGGISLCRVQPKLAPIIAVAVGGLGAARVLKGDHWPSDVAAGLLLGAVAEQITAPICAAAERALETADGKAGS